MIIVFSWLAGLGALPVHVWHGIVEAHRAPFFKSQPCVVCNKNLLVVIAHRSTKKLQ